MKKVFFFILGLLGFLAIFSTQESLAFLPIDYRDVENPDEDYEWMFQYDQPINSNQNGTTRIAGEIIHDPDRHDIDVFSFWVEKDSIVSVNFSTPSSYVFMELFSDELIEPTYNSYISQLPLLISNNQRIHQFSETELLNGVNLHFGRYFILVSTEDDNHEGEYTISLSITPKNYNESYTLSTLKSGDYKGAVWTSTFDKPITYLYEDALQPNTGDDYYTVLPCYNTYKYLNYNQILDESYIYKRFYVFDDDYARYLSVLAVTFLNKRTEILNVMGSYENIANVSIDVSGELISIIPVPGIGSIITYSLHEVANEIFTNLTQEQIELMLIGLERASIEYDGFNIAKEFINLIKNDSNETIRSLSSKLEETAHDGFNSTDFVYIDFVKNLELGVNSNFEYIHSSEPHIRVQENGNAYLGHEQEHDLYIHDGSIYIDDITYSNNQGTLIKIRPIANLATGVSSSGYFPFSETQYYTSTLNNKLYDVAYYYTTNNYYKYKKYEYYDKVCFDIYQKDTFTIFGHDYIMDDYLDTLCYYIDTSPSTLDDPILYTYNTYYNSSFTSTKYIGTYWYDYVNGSYTYIKMNTRNSVYEGDIYVRYIDTYQNENKRLIGTYTYGWTDWRQSYTYGDYYYYYYTAYTTWTDATGSSVTSSRRYFRNYTVYDLYPQ